MNRVDLVRTLELLDLAVSDTDPVQMYQCYTFTGKTALAYNDRLAIVAPCETSDAFAVNGKVLLGLLKNSRSDDVDFILGSNNEVEIKAGKSKFKLPFYSQDDFLFKTPSSKTVKELSPDDSLLAGLEACLITASRDLAQEALLGVTLKSGPGKTLALYSCDGDALTRFSLKDKGTPDIQVRLPHEFCDACIRTVKDTKSPLQQFRVLGTEWVHASTESGISLYGRLLGVDNPLDHETEIAKTIKGEPDYNPVPTPLAQALSRACVVADAESAKTELTVDNGRLLLKTDTHMGIVNDIMTWRGHPDIKADVSAALLQRAITLCDEMAILDRCTVYRKAPNLFIAVSNM